MSCVPEDRTLTDLVSTNALLYRTLQEILPRVDYQLLEFRHYSKLIVDVPKK